MVEPKLFRSSGCKMMRMTGGTPPVLSGFDADIHLLGFFQMRDG